MSPIPGDPDVQDRLKRRLALSMALALAGFLVLFQVGAGLFLFLSASYRLDAEVLAMTRALEDLPRAVAGGRHLVFLSGRPENPLYLLWGQGTGDPSNSGGPGSPNATYDPASNSLIQTRDTSLDRWIQEAGLSAGSGRLMARRSRLYLVRTRDVGLQGGGSVRMSVLEDLTGSAWIWLGLLALGLLALGVGIPLVRRVGDRMARQAVEPLQMAVLRQRRFAADASHQLKTPLSGLRGRLEWMLSEGDLPDGAADEVSRALATADRMERLLERMSRIERLEDAETAFVPVDLEALWRQQLDRRQDMIRSRGLSADLSVPRPVTIPGDPDLLGEMAGNLLDNAILYSKPGGTVRVEIAAQPDGRVEMAVIDRGIGIPESELPLLFTRFYRGENARRLGLPGSGLGLSIADAIARRHGGGIRVTSKENEGTEVRVHMEFQSGRATMKTKATDTRARRDSHDTT